MIVRMRWLTAAAPVVIASCVSAQAAQFKFVEDGHAEQWKTFETDKAVVAIDMATVEPPKLPPTIDICTHVERTAQGLKCGPNAKRRLMFSCLGVYFDITDGYDPGQRAPEWIEEIACSPACNDPANADIPFLKRSPICWKEDPCQLIPSIPIYKLRRGSFVASWKSSSPEAQRRSKSRGGFRLDPSARCAVRNPQ